MTVADGVRLERMGIPTATVISTAFSRAARSQAAGRGMGDLPIVEIPHPMHTAPKAAVYERAEAVVSDLIAALTQRRETDRARPAERLPTEIALDDAPDTLQEFFFAQGWTDGLPVVPPTHAAVRAMLAMTQRGADEEIGPIPPRMRMATIEKIAINAVMAGCRPEYFPVVLAAVDAMLDDACRLYGIRTATNNGTPLIIVNGPIAQKLDVNSGGNVFGQGWRANATIGRALQLVLRNIGGDMPGETDMSTQGQPGKFTFCIAENEQESPWEPPFHVERGFQADESTVTVIGASAGTQRIHLWLRDRRRDPRSFRRRHDRARTQQRDFPDRAADRFRTGARERAGARRLRRSRRSASTFSSTRAFRSRASPSAPCAD